MNRNYQERIDRVQKALDGADAVLIGAGAGLSSSAGLMYSGPRFTENFPDFIERYGLTDMYSSAFFPFETREEFWAYFSRHIKLNSHDAPVFDLYKELYDLVKDKNYFILTTNGDGQFFKAGFPDDRIFATQGDYRYFQCPTPCHDKLYENKEAVTRMAAEQKDCRIPSELIPYCPVCGKEMVTHLRIDGGFLENDNWHAAQERYRDFVKKAYGKRIVLFEIGVGYNTPVIIKYPFERYTADNDSATLVRINRDHPEKSQDNAEKTVVFDEDVQDILDSLSLK